MRPRDPAEDERITEAVENVWPRRARISAACLDDAD